MSGPSGALNLRVLLGDYLLIVPFLIGCSGQPAAPAPEPDPVAPVRAEAPRPGPLRAPLQAPKSTEVDLDNAAPMVVVTPEPSLEPEAESLSLLYASHGDGEIEPCG